MSPGPQQRPAACRQTNPVLSILQQTLRGHHHNSHLVLGQTPIILQDLEELPLCVVSHHHHLEGRAAWWDQALTQPHPHYALGTRTELGSKLMRETPGCHHAQPISLGWDLGWERARVAALQQGPGI